VLPEALEAVLADVRAVDADRAGVHVVEPRDEFDERALARAGRADEADRLAGFDVEGHAREHLLGVVVAEVDVVERDAPVDVVGVDGVSGLVTVGSWPSTPKTRSALDFARW